jgi:chemotaxis protein MotB
MNSLRTSVVVGLSVMIFVAIAGCGTIEKPSRLQKNAAIGGGAGGLVGATAGHFSTLGGVPGGLIGLGLGATTGAIITDTYYDDPETAGMEPEELEKLQAEVEERSQQVSTLRSQMEEVESQKQALLEAHQKTREELEKLKEKMGSDAEITQNAQGAYKMTILSDVLFDSGKAELSSAGKATLSKAARQIKKQFPNAIIEVRGHTDNVPITHSSWSSNWELSTARALAVVHYLVKEHGFSEKSLRAVGMADTQPVASNDTASGRKKNRRAEIIIYPRGEDVTTREINIQD